MRKIIGRLFCNESMFRNRFVLISIIGLMVVGCNSLVETNNNGDVARTEANANIANDVENSSESPNANEGETPESKDAENSEVEDENDSKPEIPSEEELQKIVKADMLAFDKAIKNKDFTDFHNRISDIWREQSTPASLKQNFQTFINGKADLSGVADLEAQFSPTPKIDDSKRLPILEVNGKYPTSPNDSTFELKYIPENKEWKLISLFVKTTIYK